MVLVVGLIYVLLVSSCLYFISKCSLSGERERWHHQESILDSERDSSKVKRRQFGKKTLCIMKYLKYPEEFQTNSF